MESIKKLFANAKQLQITITASEDFGLLNQESSKVYLERLMKAAEDVDKKMNLVHVFDAELDEMVLSGV